MATYLISYDLRKETSGKDYAPLITAIKSYSSWAKVLKSTWAIVTTKTSVEVRDHLANYLDNDDGLIVLKTAHDGAWKKVDCTNEWLQTNI